MAKPISLMLISLMFVLVGCQVQSASTMVDRMPAPNFRGPVMQDDVAIAPATVAAAAPAPAPVQTTTPEPRVAVPVALHAPRTHGDAPAEWTPLAKANSWQWIVIHHSATPTGGAAAFDKMHRAKGWDELGYHFVIGNGTDTLDGAIEVGSRWPKQKWGAHTKTPDNQFNEHGIGICLVGNFDVSHPTDSQVRSLSRLVAYLMKTYHVPADHVLGHRDCKSTDCPGRYLNVARIRQQSLQILTASGDAPPKEASARLARGEMLHDAEARRGEQ